MEDYQVETVDTTAESDVTTTDMQEAFDSGWDDDGLPGESQDLTEDTEETGEAEAEADQQTAEAAPDDNQTPPEQESKSDDAPNLVFELKRHNETRQMDLSKPENRDEAIAMLQKGWDYDTKISKLNGKIAEYEEFLKELAEPLGLNTEQLMDTTRARLLRTKEEKEGRSISETDALLKVQRDRAAKKNEAESQAKAEAETKEKEDRDRTDKAIRDFINEYKDVKAEDIPQEVWAEFHRTGDLVSAYTRHENAKLKAEIDALKQNAKNARRSTGSTKSEGAGTKKSAFDEGWDSI